MALQAAEEISLFESEAKLYFRTTTTFIKRERPDAIGLRWLKERFTVEVAALQLLSKRTTIPVPKLIAFGEDKKGLCYLETEYIPGSVRGDMAAEICRLSHNLGEPESPCALCEDIVRKNADQFVREVVLPQLASLTSDTTGLNGIVIPPRWVVEHDKREDWPVLSSQGAFVFCHHDLVIHNMLFCTETLRVLALVDMEECGFFPAEVQQWKYDRWGQFTLYEDKDLVSKHIKLISG